MLTTILLLAPALAATPPLISEYDVYRFRTLDCFSEARLVANWHMEYLEQMERIHPENFFYWQQRQKEACKLRCAWNRLSAARSFFDQWQHFLSLGDEDDAERYKNSCIDELDELRNLIGEDLYNEGLLPPPVPLWRFREVK